MVYSIIFIISLIICFLTLHLLLIKFKTKGIENFFMFPIFFFLYIGFISFVLSIFKKLDVINFLFIQFCVQLIVLFITNRGLLQNQTLLTINRDNFKIFYKEVTGNFLNFFLSFVVLAIIINSLLVRYRTPVYQFDDKMYRVSTPLYWIQNKSVFRFETLNERKNIFIYGSGLVYMWPMLFQIEENNALVFYWLAYPLSVLGLYLFSGLFTKKMNYRLLVVAIYSSTPNIVEYYSSSMVQESWLGLLLLCFLYFLFKDLKTENKGQKISLLVGISLGLVGFIKLTGWLYSPLILIYFYVFKNKAIKKLKYIFLGFIISLIITGNAVAIYQNTKLYDHPFGSYKFRQEHLSRISLNQLKIQASRTIFLFMEFPIFYKNISDKIENFFRGNSIILGATGVLEKENDYLWFGEFEYRLPMINIRFSIGGFIWFFSPFIVLVHYLLNKGKIKDSKIYLIIYLFFNLIIFIQLLLTKWAEGSDIPARHILSAYLIACCFFYYLLPIIYNFIGRKLSYFLLALFLLFSVQRILFLVEELNRFSNSHLEINKNKLLLIKIKEYPYQFFLSFLDSPSSFLVDEVSTTLDYPLFWYKGRQKNKVYLINNSKDFDNVEYSKEIFSVYKERNVEFLVLNNPSEELYKNLIDLKFFKVDEINSINNNNIKILKL